MNVNNPTISSLVPVFIGDIQTQQIPLCNARDLHEFLEIGKDFSNWIKDRIQQYDFEKGIDYIEFSPNLAKTPSGGRPRLEYHLTINMAKELAMVERNDKGRMIRRYFIECERRLKEGQSFADPVSATTTALKLTPLAIRAARALGLDKNAAAISVNQFVRKITNVNLLEEFGSTHLVAQDQTHWYLTPTQLGRQVRISAQKFNQKLSDLGLQIRRGNTWVPTAAAEGLYRLFDTGKQHGNGVPVTQLKWSEKVLESLKGSL